MSLLKKLLFIVFYLALSSSAKRFPPALTKCPLNDPDYESCLKKAIQEAIVYFKDGNKEYGLPPLEPLEIPQMVIPPRGFVNIIHNYTDIELYGIPSLEITAASYDPKENVLRCTMKIPELVMRAYSQLEGMIFSASVNGHGQCKLTLSQAVVKHTLKFRDVTNRKGQVVARVANYTVELNPKKVSFYFEDLFNGNKQATEVFLHVLDSTWVDVYREVKGDFENSFAIIFQAFADHFFKKIPKEQIFS